MNTFILLIDSLIYTIALRIELFQRLIMGFLEALCDGMAYVFKALSWLWLGMLIFETLQSIALHLRAGDTLSESILNQETFMIVIILVIDVGRRLLDIHFSTFLLFIVEMISVGLGLIPGWIVEKCNNMQEFILKSIEKRANKVTDSKWL